MIDIEIMRDRIHHLENGMHKILTDLNNFGIESRGLENKLKLLDALIDDIDTQVMEHDFDAMESSIISLEHDRIHVKKVEEQIRELFTTLEKIEKQLRREELAKLSTPSSASSTHIEYLLHPDRVDSLIRLLQAFETHRHHETCSREKVDPHKPCTSHCKSSDSSQDILYLNHFDVHQTSIVKESFVRFLSLLLIQVWGLPGSSTLISELSLAESFLTSTPELVCRVERYADRIHLQFLDGNHPERVHSEITLHRNFRNN